MAIYAYDYTFGLPATVYFRDVRFASNVSHPTRSDPDEAGAFHAEYVYELDFDNVDFGTGANANLPQDISLCPGEHYGSGYDAYVLVDRSSPTSRVCPTQST